MDYREAEKYYPGWRYPEVIAAFDTISNKIIDLADIAKLSQEDKNKIFFDLVTLEHHLRRWCK